MCFAEGYLALGLRALRRRWALAFLLGARATSQVTDPPPPRLIYITPHPHHPPHYYVNHAAQVTDPPLAHASYT